MNPEYTLLCMIYNKLNPELLTQSTEKKPFTKPKDHGGVVDCMTMTSLKTSLGIFGL